MAKKGRAYLLAAFWGAALLTLSVSVSYALSRWDYWTGKDLNQLWQAQDYQQLVRMSEQHLRRDPLDLRANVFGGMAYFYTSLGSEVYLESWPELRRSVQLLRRSIALNPDVTVAGPIYYLLGKAYARLGASYLNLALHYLELSLESGYRNQDSFESLALAYLQTGDYARSLAYFLKVEQEGLSDVFLLKLADNLNQQGRQTQAADRLEQVIQSTQNDRLRQEALFKLATIHYNEGDLEMAKRVLEQSDQQHNAEALYLLGEIYFRQGENVLARAYWREALTQDPQHRKARERLVN